MHINTIYPILLALLALYPSSTIAKKTPKDAILLSSVKSLTLRANAKTSHRRVSAIPQLTCKGPGCKHYTVDVMRCTNQGSDYSAEDIQWSCVASLPEEFKLGSTDVVCEGYANRDDEYVLKGSCGVEYRLLLTDKGEEKYGHSYFGGNKGSGEGSTLGAALFMLLFVGVGAWILYSMYLAYLGAPNARRQPRRPGGFWGGGWGGGPGGGGGGPGDPWDPPPPYPGKRYSTAQGQAGQQGWQPGFWTGALGGAAAGYMAGNRGNREPEVVQRGNSWFGGGSSGRSNWGSTPRPSASNSGSGARHESTGFGSTSRR